MNDLSNYSADTLGSLYRAFIKHEADFIWLRYSKHTPKWMFDDVDQLIRNGDAFEKDASDSQETISKIYLKQEFKNLLTEWRG